MADLPETFDIPAELRDQAQEIRNRYAMALPFQMADELVNAGVALDVAFHIAVGDLRVAAARLAVMACEIQKRQPRRELWLKRAEEDLSDAQEWLTALRRNEQEAGDAPAIGGTSESDISGVSDNG